MTATFALLDAADRALLVDQLDLMERYGDILTARIARFPKDTP